MRAVLGLACVLGLSACTHQAPVQTTIPAAMASIQSSLAQAGVVSVSHAGDWTAEQDARFTRAVRAAQCSQHTPDPVVDTIAGDVTLQLSGQFTQGGQFSVGTASTVPTFGVQADASRTRAQVISLPVAYAPLSSLPDVEMGRQLGYEAAVFAQNDDARHAEASRLIADREELRGRVQAMVDSWTVDECRDRVPIRPFAGIRR
ncbi:hypothetical protein ACM0P6_02705 [Komagataeibacter sucrofermentans]|uniref:Lipoprotein n=1 Tax=Komagataeibacter sucrofermentans TaxID=1053551 RepID=A0A318QXL6_9PROT|nr:hypothetical protein [Komagataeibacter sucrofermentans]PYD80009.1 hypothetical protein CFR77_05735 [Komagataeibacter sucrofermentans]GBQ52316.1 hypothetical protein AA15973_2738 [Komagataeibacter sucrofermentans DSM 15973]